MAETDKPTITAATKAARHPLAMMPTFFMIFKLIFIAISSSESSALSMHQREKQAQLYTALKTKKDRAKLLRSLGLTVPVMIHGKHPFP
jgi:hypothetical protein